MSAKYYPKRYEEALRYINLPFDETIKKRLKELELEGYKEYNISYAIYRGQEKIMKFRYDNRLWSVLVNEVRKYAYKSKS